MATTTPIVIPLKPALTLKQRLMAEATETAKWIGIGGKALAAASLAAANITSIPSSWTIAAGIAAGIMIAIEQLDVDWNKLSANGMISFSSVFSTIPNVVKEANAISADVTKIEKVNLAPVSVDNVEAVLENSGAIINAGSEAVGSKPLI